MKQRANTTFIDPKDARDIVSGRHNDLYSVLGLHLWQGKMSVRVFMPGAEAIDVHDEVSDRKMFSLAPVPGAEGLFTGQADGHTKRFAYNLHVRQGEHSWTCEDPFRFGPVMGELDEYLLGEGSHNRLWEVLGAHIITHEGVTGTHFAVWAPNASRVSLVGEFNSWDGRRHGMRQRGRTGVWELFFPGLGEGHLKKKIQYYVYLLLSFINNSFNY